MGKTTTLNISNSTHLRVKMLAVQAGIKVSEVAEQAIHYGLEGNGDYALYLENRIRERREMSELPVKDIVKDIGPHGGIVNA